MSGQGIRPHIPEEVAAVIARVGGIVSPVYLVGGSVRDLLLGNDPHDYDFTTPVLPDDVEAAVRAAGLKPYLTGKRFGTIGVAIDGHHIEITTFRRETYEARSRKPVVSFVDNITYDLSRRDFTINAMALREDGRLVDPFDGVGDLKKKLIRAVGNPSERFREDPLRILRAARFSARLGCAIDPLTEARAEKKAHHILDVSRERWSSELDGLLMADDPSEGFRFLARTRVLTFMIPELAIQYGFDQDSPYHELDLFEHTLKTVRLTRTEVTLRWAALFHDIGKSFTRTVNQRGYSNYIFHDKVGAEIVERLGRYLKWSNERRTAVYELVRDHLDLSSPLHDADIAATKAG